MKSETAQTVIPFEEFALPFNGKLRASNRWVRLAKLIPWEKYENQYAGLFSSNKGAPAITFRIAFGALIVKERLRVPDRESVAQIQENPYIQYFLGFREFKDETPFDPSMYVHFRKRISSDVITKINEEIILTELNKNKSTKDKDGSDDRDSKPSDNKSENSGKMIIDATCTPADIRYPVDLSILDEARTKTEGIIDTLWLHRPKSNSSIKKPRTYRKKARKEFVNTIRKKNLKKSVRRMAIRKQLNFISRNLKHIQELSQFTPLNRLSKFQFKCLLVIHEVYRQQQEMYASKEFRVDDRIVSITQPHVRPIVRGKAGVKTEFGAKLSASVHNGYTFVDKISWNAYNEGGDLVEQADEYRKRLGFYPESILGDKIYCNRKNRQWCTERNIKLSGPPLGRPKMNIPKNIHVIKANKKQARQDEIERIEVEAKFGNVKRRFSLNRVMAKLSCTSKSVITMAFLVMNLEKILRDLFCLFLSMLMRGVESIMGAGKWKAGRYCFESHQFNQ